MKSIVTGANGTVGSAMVSFLESQGEEVVKWDRSQVPMDDYWAMHEFVKSVRPNAIYHLAIASQPTGRENEGWIVNYHWPTELAWIARQLHIRFVFTSTVMVWTNQARGPYTPESRPDETEGYGADKLNTENKVRSQNPDSIIARLGWQIGDGPGTNNMIDFLEKQQKENGEIRASTLWKPATSFTWQTAAALHDLASQSGGTYLVNSNRSLNFYQIVCALNKMHGNRWKVVPTEDFVYDQRMLDDRVMIDPLAEVLGLAESVQKPAK